MARTLNALDLLHRDHQLLKGLLKRFDDTDDEKQQRELRDRLVDELRTHTEIEEQLFYPYMRDATGREDLYQEATIEHRSARDLLEQLPREPLMTPRIKAMAKVLGEHLEMHITQEEREIFPQVEKSGVDLEALGQALEECRGPEEGPGQARERRPAAAQAGAARKEARGTGAERSGAKADRDDAEARRADAPPSAEDDERFVREHGEQLSRSTRRAHWIHRPEDRPERDGQTLATRSLEVIRRWAEARGARPATTPGGDVERPRVLRFDFPDFDKGLQELSWEAWGRTFDERRLVFVFQENKRDGKQSNFFILDSPDREEG